VITLNIHIPRSASAWHYLQFLSFRLLGSQDGGTLKLPGVSRGAQRYVIDGLSEKSSVVAEPWERLLDILALVGARCEWQGDKGQRSVTQSRLIFRVIIHGGTSKKKKNRK